MASVPKYLLHSQLDVSPALVNQPQNAIVDCDAELCQLSDLGLVFLVQEAGVLLIILQALHRSRIGRGGTAARH